MKNLLTKTMYFVQHAMLSFGIWLEDKVAYPIQDKSIQMLYDLDKGRYRFQKEKDK